MIRQEAFTGDVEAFASKRRTLLTKTDERLQPHVADALKRVGLPSWQAPLVRAALDVFDEVARTEVEEWGPGLDVLRSEFERELTEALDKTKKADKAEFLKQVERVTKWVSVMSINAGTEAATSTDPDPAVGLEWVTMEDDKVRDSHKEAHGQQVVSGKPFTINGSKLLYPGEPVGPPENWINCRCVARPAMLDESASSVTAAAKPVVDEDEMPETVIPREEPDEAVEDDAPFIPDEEAAIQIPFHGVACPEGIMSGDGRGFAVGAVTNRPLPLPLKAMFTDDDGHKGSTIAGRIDNLWRDGNLIKYDGVFDMGEAGYESIRLIADGMWRGVSVDVDQAQGEMTPDGKGTMYTQARISGLTECAIPAFAEAFIALGPWEEPAKEETPVITGEEVDASAETFEVVPPRTKDGPGWITDPDPTHDITSYWVTGPGRAKIGWGSPGDFNRCRVKLGKYVMNPEWLAGLCSNLHYRALGTWPGRGAHSGGILAMNMDESAELPSVNLTASAATAVSADYFRKPELSGPTPMTITDDGHVFGHLALWDTCHIGRGEPCVIAPHSQTNYAYFLTGEFVTDSGRVPVGQITLGTGHASDTMGMRAALSHYDNTGSAVADITIFEDDHGISFTGKLREDLSPRQIADLRAAPLSGDWRGVLVNGTESLEMCAALAVNVPGFVVPRVTYAMDGDHQLSLTAAGALEPRPVITPEFEEQMQAYNERQDRRRKLAALKAKGRSFRAEALRSKVAWLTKKEDEK